MKLRNAGLLFLMPLAMSLTGCESSDHLYFDYGASSAEVLKKSDPSQIRMDLNAKMSCCVSLAQMDYQPTSKPGQLDVFISSESQVYDFSSGKSYFEAIQLPKSEGDLTITLSSVILSSAFIPSVLVLDSAFQPIRQIGADQIRYAKASLLNGDRYFGQFTLSENDKARYLVIYTTAAAMNGETILEPLSAEALESGSAQVAQRVYANKPIPHSPIGVVRLALDFVIDTRVEKSINLADQAAAPQPQDLKQSSASETVEPETAAMFRQLIENAVKAGDLNKAMNMVQEAERAGFGQARQILIEAISAQ
jgi:maltose operon protein